MDKKFEKKRVELELLKVSTAKAELEFKIEERLQEIERIKEHIVIQEKRQYELKQQINQMEK